MARTFLPAITVTIAGVAQRSETTIDVARGHAVISTSALPLLGITLASSYLASPVGAITSAHLCISPGLPALIEQHVLPVQPAGRTHAQACLLDHVSELQARLIALTGEHVSIDVDDATLAQADSAWHAQDERAG